MSIQSKVALGRSCIGAVALLGFSAPAPAQDTGSAPPPVAPPAPTVEGPQTYTAQDFVRYAPRTALDMLRQVPGFIIQGQSQERGLGQASGNVLINGQRISGKSNDAVTELGRIPAGSVVRIEIVDGATLNIAGLSGHVANVVAKASG
ncbi:MAG TPA: TonB-dependent receptor plug domain-containing protein, partial [Allosphingosinicella sp.]|nr:TonB-dependent receptor plug domain-containing protein [Allosphingosinicella sp.]